MSRPPIFDRTSRWFERARAALLDQLPCRAGCCRCCIGPFPITVLDAEELRRGVSRLPREERLAIEERAGHQAAAMAAADPRLAATPIIDGWVDADVDRLAEQFADSPCPSLGSDGRCLLYEYRPLACRSMGIPYEEGGFTQGACEVQNFVPVTKLSPALLEEEARLSREEAKALQKAARRTGAVGEEMLLPFGFFDCRS